MASMAFMMAVISLFFSSSFRIGHISNFDLHFVHNLIVTAVTGCMASMAFMMAVISLFFSSSFRIGAARRAVVRRFFTLDVTGNVLLRFVYIKDNLIVKD